MAKLILVTDVVSGKGHVARFLEKGIPGFVGEIYLEDVGVDVWMRTGALLGYYGASSDNFYTYRTQINEIHNFLN